MDNETVAIIIIVQTVIALGLRLVLNELQIGKYATASKQSQQKDYCSRVQSGRLLFFRLRCFCRRFRCFARTFTLISCTDRTSRIDCPCFTFCRAATHSSWLLFSISIFHQCHQIRFIHLVQKVNSSLFILIRPVDQNVKIIASLGGNSNELLITSKIIHQCRIPLRCKCRCWFCFFHNHIAIIGRILCRCRRSLF